MSEKLIFKSINALLGEHFYIPYYQRGYRWTKQQVTDLLNDIWTFSNKRREIENEFYCLQPIVIKAKTWNENEEVISGWEVVDGQQRLTTIYIILSYLAKEFLKVDSLDEEYGKDIFSLRYETRPGSELFLKDITDDKSNIDYYHMSEAYKTVREWFKSGEAVKDRSDRDKFLRTLLGKDSENDGSQDPNEISVRVIWYEVSKTAKSLELFTRLNIGKIPLTNSELIKALFLASSSFQNEEDGEKKKLEISLLWDEMEQKLNDADFWAFSTNAKQSAFANKIELIFDMIADKTDKIIDPLYTFITFFNQTKENQTSLWDMWIKIEKYFSTLQEWFRNKNLYHKVGYLITIGEGLKTLIEGSLTMRKDDFERQLDEKIRKSVHFNIEELSYDRNGDYKKIERVLLLFNVESIRTNESITEFYPFKFHKSTYWSLEHIHAQNSEGLDKTKREQWISWLKSHKSLLKELVDENVKKEKSVIFMELIEEIDSLNEEYLTWERFNSLSERIAREFSEDADVASDEEHGISNLALIGQAQNAALNNSVFEVKRREIIKMDQEGKYIPICTRRAFLKYYNSKPSSEHYYFWSHEDRKNYLAEIKRVLGMSNYLPTFKKMEAE